MLVRYLKIALTATVFPLGLAIAQSPSIAGTWSTLPGTGVTFGGSGIVGPVMQARVGTNGPWLTLGATPRFDNAPLTNDGAGTFFASPGADACTPAANAGCPNPAYARWNFNYAVTGSNLTEFEFRLRYSITPDGSLVPVFADLPLGVEVFGIPVPLQNSLNIGMTTLYSYGIATGAAMSPADVNAQGTYRYSLEAYQLGTDILVGQVGIAVQTVNTTVPEPGTWALTLMGVALLSFARRRRV
jgi:hypothetical protein